MRWSFGPPHLTYPPKKQGGFSHRFLKEWFPKRWFPKGGFGGCAPVPILFLLFDSFTFWQFGVVSLSPRGGRPRPSVFPELRFAVHWGSALVGCGHRLECRGGGGDSSWVEQARRYHICTLRIYGGYRGRYDGTTPVPSRGTTVPPLYAQEVRRYPLCTWRWYACAIPVCFYTQITPVKMTVVPRAGTRVVPLYLVQVQGWHRRTCSRCIIHSSLLNTFVFQFYQTIWGGKQQFSCKFRADATPNRSSLAPPNPRGILLGHAHHMTATQWPLGHLTWPLNPPKNKEKTNKKNQKIQNMSFSVMSLNILFWGGPKFPFFDNLAQRNAPQNHYKNSGFGNPIFGKQITVTKWPFWHQKFQLSFLGPFLSFWTTKTQNLAETPLL